MTAKKLTKALMKKIEHFAENPTFCAAHFARSLGISKQRLRYAAKFAVKKQTKQTAVIESVCVCARKLASMPRRRGERGTPTAAEILKKLKLTFPKLTLRTLQRMLAKARSEGFSLPRRSSRGCANEENLSQAAANTLQCCMNFRY